MGNQNHPLTVSHVFKRFSRESGKAISRSVKQLTHELFGFSYERGELQSDEFWAVRDANFTVAKGESLALLGLNGSGKSTLLKMIYGTLPPDCGEIRTVGVKEGLIELGAGFHPSLSGRENLRLRAAMKGLGGLDAQRYFDQVIEFSELKDFIDSPVGSYSSGMYARLGFSASAFINPDLLIIDEILSVGDFQFQQRCLDRLNKIRLSCAVIFVSHSMSTVKMFCNRGIVMERGVAAYSGPIEEACAFYLNSASRQKIGNNNWAHAGKLGPFYRNDDKVEDVSASIQKIAGDFSVDSLKTGDTIAVSFEFKLKEPPTHPIHVGIPFWQKNVDGMVAAFNSDESKKFFFPDSKGIVKGKLIFKNPFLTDEIAAVLAVHVGPEYLLRIPLDPIKSVASGARQMGKFYVSEHQWE